MSEDYGSLKHKVPKSEGEAPDAPKAFKEFSDSITKPPTGGTGQLLIVQSTGAAAYKAMKGDAALAEDGTLTIANGAISPAKVAASAIEEAKLADGATTSRKFKPTQGKVERALGSAVTLEEKQKEVLKIELTPPVASVINLVGYIDVKFSSAGVIHLYSQAFLDGVGKDQGSEIDFEVAKSMGGHMMVLAQLPLTVAAHTIEIRAGAGGASSATAYGRMLWWLTS